MTPQQHLAQADSILRSIIETVPEPIMESTMESTNDVFFDLMSCIFEQQIHYRSTKKTFQKMLDDASIDVLTPENFSLFEERAVKNASIAASKLETAERILVFWEGTLPEWNALSDEEVRSTLASIKGVGAWTIDMMLLYTLKRPNIFPADDFHLKQIMVSLYGLNEKSRLTAQMRQKSEAWSPHKSLATKYLLAWKDYQKQIRK